MGHDLIREKRAAAKRLVVFQGEDDDVALVYQIRRVRSEDIQAAGFAEILGPGALAAAEESARRLQDQERLIASAPTPEAKAEREAELQAILAQENERAVEALTADEGRVRTLLRRCEAYLMAAVEGVGKARDDAPHGILKRGITPAEVCAELEPGEYIRKGRFVPGPDAKDGEIPLSEIPAAERVALGLMVITALEVASAVQTFPGRTGAARAR